MRRIGWNAVRLLVSWSRVEPAPGRYDERYLALVARTARRLGPRGAGRRRGRPPGRVGRVARRARRDGLPAGLDAGARLGRGPAVGDRGRRRLALRPRRPGGGARGPRRVAGLLRRPGRRAAAVRGHVGPRRSPPARRRRGRGLRPPQRARRAGRRRPAGALGRLRRRAGRDPPGARARGSSSCSSPRWPGRPRATARRPAFRHDADVVYAPHLYTGGFTANDPITAPAFRVARDEARGFGGAPVLSGEWGTGPGAGRHARRLLRRPPGAAGPLPVLGDALDLARELRRPAQGRRPPRRTGAGGLGALRRRLPHERRPRRPHRARRDPDARLRPRRAGAPGGHGVGSRSRGRCAARAPARAGATATSSPSGPARAAPRRASGRAACGPCGCAATSCSPAPAAAAWSLVVGPRVTSARAASSGR